MIALKRMTGRVLCLIGDHLWTCLASEGIPPDAERVKADPSGYFFEYAAMYCKRDGCGARYEGRP